MRSTHVRFWQAFASLPLATVVGQVLTSYNPCPQDSQITPIPVTAQYQPVSTCFPSLQCTNSTCSTSYSYETHNYVSTVIPCAFNGVTVSTCTITATDETVVLSTASTTLTAVFTGSPHGHGRVQRPHVYTVVETRDRKVEAGYGAIGSIGIPGYSGSGLCYDCEGPAGILEQAVVVTECRSRLNEKPQQPRCQRKEETWIQLPSEMQTTPVTATCSSRFPAASAGVFTFSFEQRAPPRLITGKRRAITEYIRGRPTIYWGPARTITIPAQPWHAVVTQTCTGPTVIDFTMTVTTTITVTSPTIVISDSS